MIIVMKIFRLAALIILAMGMQYPSYSQTTDVSPELTKLISIFSDNIPNGFGNDQDHFYLVEFGKDSTLVSRPRLGFDVLLIRYIETKHHPFTYKSFRIINNHKVYFYGKKNSFFSFNALNRVKLPEKSAEPLGIIDPSDYEWRICLFKDGSINEYLTERNILTGGTQIRTGALMRFEQSIKRHPVFFDILISGFNIFPEDFHGWESASRA